MNTANGIHSRSFFFPTAFPKDRVSCPSGVLLSWFCKVVLIFCNSHTIYKTFILTLRITSCKFHSIPYPYNEKAPAGRILSAGRSRLSYFSVLFSLIKCKYRNFVRSQRVCHMVWLSVTLTFDRFKHLIFHLMFSAVSRICTA